jgi:energy-coupling factor transporter transmembrane protein EcfT
MTPVRVVEDAKTTRPAPPRASIRRASDFHVLRYVAGTSPIHRMWAGTKLLWFASISIGLLLWPTWYAVGVGAVMVLGGFGLARLPRGVAPRLPRWIWLLVLIGAVIAFVASGAPYVHVAGVRVGFGGLEQFARFWAITAEILGVAALVSWTTPLADLAPALGRLASPLRRIRVPVDELVGAVGLSIRCLPLLLEEGRVLSAARRSRRTAGKRAFRDLAQEAEDIIWAALSNALRRAREIAEAIEARGGVPTVAPETHEFALRDGLMLVVAAASVAAMAVLR